MPLQIDREQWDLEYQQVAPRLHIRVAAEARDWRTHLEAASEHLRRAFPDHDSAPATSGADHASGVSPAAMAVQAWPQTKKHLQQVHNEVSEQLAKISTREHFLNSEFAARTDEYRNKKMLHEQKQARYLAHTSSR